MALFSCAAAGAKMQKQSESHHLVSYNLLAQVQLA